MQPRFTTQARPAASSTTTSSAVLPDGNVSSAVRIQSGRLSGARFWKNGSLVMPSTKRFSAMGQPRTTMTRLSKGRCVVRRDTEAARGGRHEGKTMRDAILIYDAETANPSPELPDPAVFGQVMAAYNAYTEMLRQRGAYLGGEALQP